MYSTRFILKWSVISIFFLSVCGYGIYQALPYLTGPIFIIEAPRPGETLTEALQTIRGTTKRVHILTINGETIPLDEEGRFKNAVLLSPGINYISVVATDAFGHITEQVITVLYREY